MAEVGLAPREIRLVILSLGLILAGSGRRRRSPRSAAAPSWLALALGAIGVLGTITIIQRILHVRNQAVAGGGK